MAQSDAAKPKILLKAEVVFVRGYALDTPGLSHVNFDVLPLSSGGASAPPEDREELEYAVGYPVTLLHQKLLQKTPETAITEILFFPPAVSTTDGVPATLSFHEEVPDPLRPALTVVAPRSLPHVKQTLVLEGSLTLTPHLNFNKTIALDLSLPTDPAGPQATEERFRLRSVTSGDLLLLRNFFPNTGNRAEPSSAILLRSYGTLLIFVTPILAADGKQKAAPAH